MPDNDTQLEALLMRRRMEPPRTGLEERIIAASRGVPQAGRISLAMRLQEIFAECMLPRPAYALATALMLGVAVGFSAAEELMLAEDEASSLVFMDDSGVFL